MNAHEKARLTPHSRAELVRRVLEEGQPRKVVAAAAFGVDPKTVGKWVNRFQTQGAVGLADRSSRPRRLRSPTPPEVQDQIIILRRQRLTGQQIAVETRVSPATVSRVLRRARLNRIRDLEPAEPVRRYERDAPLPQGGHRLLRQPRRRRDPRHDRQRRLLQSPRLPRRLQSPRPQAHPHQTLHALSEDNLLSLHS